MEASELLARIEKLEGEVGGLKRDVAEIRRRRAVRPKRAFRQFRSIAGLGDEDVWDDVPEGGGSGPVTYNFGGLMGALTNREAAVVVPALKGFGTGIGVFIVSSIAAIPVAGTTHNWWWLTVPPITGAVVGTGTFLGLMAWHELRLDRAATGKAKQSQTRVTAIEHQQKGENGLLERVRFLYLDCEPDSPYRLAEYVLKGGSLAVNNMPRTVMHHSEYRRVRGMLISYGYLEDRGSNVGTVLTQDGRGLMRGLVSEGMKRGVLSKHAHSPGEEETQPGDR